MKRLIVLLAVMGVAVGLLAYSRMRTSAPRISGFIEADEIRVGSRVGGRVAEVLVAEGEAVRSGQALMRLDPYDLHERLAEAKAQLAARTAVYEKLKAGLRPEEIAQAQAKVDGLTATVAKLVAGPRQKKSQLPILDFSWPMHSSIAPIAPTIDCKACINGSQQRLARRSRSRGRRDESCRGQRARARRRTATAQTWHP